MVVGTEALSSAVVLYAFLKQCIVQAGKYTPATLLRTHEIFGVCIVLPFSCYIFSVLFLLLFLHILSHIFPDLS